MMQNDGMVGRNKLTVWLKSGVGGRIDGVLGKEVVCLCVSL
jgi:hypothetical protein